MSVPPDDVAADHAALFLVAGDEVYGGNPHLRTALEERQVGYVLVVACDHRITTRAGKLRVDALIKKLPKRAWQTLSAGAGAKGHRCYDWAPADITDSRPGHRHLLVRRKRRTGELAFCRCYSAAGVSLSTLVKVAGRKWTVEEIFQSGNPQPDWTNTRSGAGRRRPSGPGPHRPRPTTSRTRQHPRPTSGMLRRSVT